VIADAIRIERLSALHAEVAAAGSGQVASAAALEESDVRSVFDTAVAHWSAVDATAAARLADVDVHIADLSGEILGLASATGRTIWLDQDAAGHGWNVNPQSAIRNPQSMDLLSVVTHELGHVLGLPDLDPEFHPHDVMAGRLDAGLRRLPVIGETSISAAPMSRGVGSMADRLFADLGGLFADRDSDPFGELDAHRREAITPGFERDRSGGAWSQAAGRVLDDDEDLLTDRVERRAVGRDEDSADQLFAELTDRLARSGFLIKLGSGHI
jgi:hypothetical protein